jgi:demethylmenaquinone methyltransferase/2-methoxy-6-polyprenyl-1,4-benzoquinol methylase
MTANTSKPIAATEPMFSAIAGRYDLCNHLFSFGLDFYWRKKAANLCLCRVAATESACSTAALGCDNFRVAATESASADEVDGKVSSCDKSRVAPASDLSRRSNTKTEACGCFPSALDLCCGTGDMTFALADTGRVKSITACDISLPMLDCAKRKHSRRAVSANRVAPTSEACGCFPSTPIEWLHRSAENTGLPNASFDLITCAFGLRNVDDIPQTLKEMVRLLRPGGTACILEFFLPQNRLLRSIYLFHLRRLMPLAARAIAGSPAPWHYLARSIEQWEKVNLPEQLQNAGFRDVSIRPLTFATVRVTLACKK